MRFGLRILATVGLATLVVIGLGAAQATGLLSQKTARAPIAASPELPEAAAAPRRLPTPSALASPSTGATQPSAAPVGQAPRLPAPTFQPVAGCVFGSFPPYFLRFPKWKPIAPCVTAVGTVVSVALQPDGDYHVDVLPDPGSRWLLNDANFGSLRGLLRTEIVPQWQLAGLPVRTPLPPPRPGAHIRVSGAEVLDVGHAGWTEIHPVYSWSIL